VTNEFALEDWSKVLERSNMPEKIGVEKNAAE
jgi:hypothetical protein